MEKQGMPEAQKTVHSRDPLCGASFERTRENKKPETGFIYGEAGEP